MCRENILFKIRDKIHESPKDFVFFTGAGISRDAPSLVPLAVDVKKELLSTLVDKIRDAAEKTGANFKIEEFSGERILEEISSKFFMESLFEIVQIRLGIGIDEFGKALKGIFESMRPNGNHYALARLHSMGCGMVTTNFDQLLEMAYEQQHPFTKASVMHLHGSVDDVESMIVTLGQVGKGLPPEVKASLRDAVNGRTLIVAGWSDNDIDITPEINLCDISAVVWICHCNRKAFKIKEYKKRVVDNVGNNNDSNKNKNIENLLWRFGGYKIIGNTNRILNIFCDGNFFVPKGNAFAQNAGELAHWERAVEQLIDNADLYSGCLLYLELLDRAVKDRDLLLILLRYIEAIERLFVDKVASDPQAKHHVAGLLEIFCKKSVRNRSRKKYREAIESAKAGFKYAKDLGSLSYLCELRNDIASAYHSRAVDLLEMGKWGCACVDHIRSIAILKKNLKLLSKKLRTYRAKNADVGTKSLASVALLLFDAAQVRGNLRSIYSRWFGDSKYSELHLIPWPGLLQRHMMRRTIEQAGKCISLHEEIRSLIGKMQEYDGTLGKILNDYNDFKLGDAYRAYGRFCYEDERALEAHYYYNKSYNIMRNCGNIRGLKSTLDAYVSLFNKCPDLMLGDDFEREIRSTREVLDSVFMEGGTAFFQVHLILLPIIEDL